MTRSISNPLADHDSPLLERMRRARRTDGTDTVTTDDASAPKSAPHEPDAQSLVDDALLDTALDIASRLMNGDLCVEQARRQVIRACLQDGNSPPDNSDIRADTETHLNNDLQFRAEVDNMLVLAARELEGGPQ
jgi:hypothetical protein